ncbi:MAG: histidine--tRNA ligase [Endomicrobiia bacterium]|nr:histidine--tRNA ligase [Endomicrobiaceae bacterium]MDD3922415.1 histidine--tRNA ligase [Endomicrobiaceae bacterium]MDD5102687.1 histidine--tRNA ligase [Endomicrobiaceae bacterium]
MSIYKAPRGTHDIFGKLALGLEKLDLISRQVFRKHNFKEVRTPIFEDVSLFTRSIGEATDIVEKEMYVFEDRKGRKLALRPEGTASLVRAYIEHRFDMTEPIGKFFYSGEMFRYERPQAGRYRQFLQMGAEYLANPSPNADVEIILVAKEILSTLNIKDITIHLNSLGCPKCRAEFRQKLVDYFASISDLCEDCKRRLEKNPLRLLDCKIDSNKFQNVPTMQECLCDDCNNHFQQVQALLKRVDCDYIVDHKLVRGLDYYTRTVFEVRSSSVGSQDALCAGGRYDNLVKELGGQQIPSVGFALGCERVLMACEQNGFFDSLQTDDVVFIALADEELFVDAFTFANDLILNNNDIRKDICLSENIIIEGPFLNKSLKSQFKLADKIGAKKTIIFGKNEFDKGKIIVKDMVTQEQKEVKLPDYCFNRQICNTDSNEVFKNVKK